MRELVTLSDETHARRLAAALQVEHIPSSVDPEDDQWVVWIENDDDRDRAESIRETFLKNPQAEEYDEAMTQAARRARSEQKKREAIRRKQVDLSKRWSGSWWHCYPATQILTILCVAVVLVTTDWRTIQPGMMGLPDTCNKADSPLLNALFFQPPSGVRATPDGTPYPVWRRVGLMEIVSTGQLWRFVTPAFIHFGVVHILFNMLWLRTLGMAIEFIRGTRRFLLLVLITAVISHTAQFLWAGPAFGGMSGVVYGLIGYVWIRGRTRPEMGLGLTPNQVVYAILWLFLCMGGVFGPIANAAHLGGFVSGALIGGRFTLAEWITGPPSESDHDPL